jgi:hypothetical protein
MWWESNAYPQLYIYRNDGRWFSIVELGQFLDARVPLIITPSLTGFPFEEWTFARPNGNVLFKQRVFTAVLAEPAVPEPSLLTLILLGIGGLTCFRRHHANSATPTDRRQMAKAQNPAGRAAAGRAAADQG